MPDNEDPKIIPFPKDSDPQDKANEQPQEPLRSNLGEHPHDGETEDKNPWKIELIGDFQKHVVDIPNPYNPDGPPLATMNFLVSDSQEDHTPQIHLRVSESSVDIHNRTINLGQLVSSLILNYPYLQETDYPLECKTSPALKEEIARQLEEKDDTRQVILHPDYRSKTVEITPHLDNRVETNFPESATIVDKRGVKITPLLEEFNQEAETLVTQVTIEEPVENQIVYSEGEYFTKRIYIRIYGDKQTSLSQLAKIIKDDQRCEGLDIYTNLEEDQIADLKKQLDEESTTRSFFEFGFKDEDPWSPSS